MPIRRRGRGEQRAYSYQFESGKVPPCSRFLGNINPIIRDGRLIYRNENRLYFFISTTKTSNSTVPGELETTSPIAETPTTSTNLQVSLATYLVGLYINEIQLGKINYDKNCKIHYNDEANTFIHEMMQKNPKVQVDYQPEIAVIYSNSDAILPLFTQATNITPINYYILFLLNRLEMNPGLFFGNNGFITEDPINFTLASLDLWFHFPWL